MNPAIEVRTVSKSFGAVRALSDVSVRIAPGTIHAFVGENGAGKSTLGRVICGAIRPDGGTLLVDGREVRYANPSDALKDGITTITQEIALLPNQTAVENVLLGAEPTRCGVLDRKAMRARFGELIEATGFDIRPTTRVRDLRLADQKRVEVLQAIARGSRIIVMDEPTAMLASDEALAFHEIVRMLRDDGCTIIYVSHFLQEVLDLADTVTVMRNGKVVNTHSTSDVHADELVEEMIGRRMGVRFPVIPEESPDAEVVFRATGIHSKVFRGIDLTVHAGEIVGIAGLVGSGRTRLARTLIGAEPITEGQIEVRGQLLKIRHPSDAIRAGIHYLSESRKEQGLLLRQDVKFNMSLPHLKTMTSWADVVHVGIEKQRVEELTQNLDIRAPGSDTKVANLSGGNQQKVLFGMWLFDRPNVLIVDEPTRGVDVAAKKAIYDLIVQLAADGIGIVLISSEIEEILALSHRVLVMREAQIVASFKRTHGELNESRIMRAAFGSHQEPIRSTKNDSVQPHA